MRTPPFLQQVASHYASDDKACQHLADYAFVLPNRRSAQQMERYFKAQLNANTLMPRLMSMNDLVDHIMRESNPIIASPIETLFIAYMAYRDVMQDRAGTFDGFAHWGQLIVKDFNDVDMNLVDAHSLFTNLSDLKDIQANYLDNDDLKETIRAIFGIRLPGNDSAQSPMWKNQPDDDGVKSRYLSLWNCMSDIYTRYGELLAHNGLTTQGKLYRNAIDVLKNTAGDDMGFERIVMVGHDMLTVSELSIFKILKNKGIAHYWWDDASPALNNESNPATRIMGELTRAFKAPQPIEPINAFPQVTVNYVPGKMGMAKCAFEGIKSVNNTTAIVLPDELLLEPLLNSLPCELLNSYDNPSQALNITMGYSLRRSNISTLIHLVTTAHRHATLHGDKGWMFYREDVRDILSHPIIKMVYTSTVLRLNNSIEEQMEFNIPASRFVGTELEPLFTTLHTTMVSKGEVMKFIGNLERFCDDLDLRLSASEEMHDDDTRTTTLSLQRAFIRLYVSALNQLRIAIDNVGLPVNDDTIFYLIARAAAGALVPFGGKSGEGIQVMGLLETRCIDFDDLRILSANEGTLPQRTGSQSLIPNRFRAAFNMPTIELNDATQIYRFYRLVSRASKVTLYCDTSNNSEPSRFVEQLHKIYGLNLSRVKRTASVTIAHDIDITIDNAQLREEIKQKYTQGDIHDHKSGARTLSASSIKEFIKCPLKFYFHHLQGLSNDNERSDFMDSSQFGTIVHDTLQAFYYPHPNSDTPRQRRFARQDIEEFEKKRLDTLLTREINRTFNHKPLEHLDDTLTGQAFILNEALKTYVKRALACDRMSIGDGVLEVIECEETHPLKLRLNDEVTINFTFKADRIDRIGNTLRIIDYKTGKDDTRFASVNEFIDPAAKKHPEAVMQLLLYCMAYVQLKGDELRAMGITHIEPLVYLLSTKDKWEVKQKINQRTTVQVRLSVDNFFNEELIVEFGNAMAEAIKQLWESPIAQPAIELDRCKYCNFTPFCRR